MPRQSLFEYKGSIGPSELIPPITVTYNLNRPQGSLSIEVDQHAITVRFAANYESFDDLFRDTFEFVLGFFAVGAIRTGIAVELRFDEWTETPLDSVDAQGATHRVRGQVLHKDPDAPPPLFLPEDYTFGLAHGLHWSQDLAANPFLRRGVLDFNHALKHPLNDVPIYLARSIESVANFFGGEKALITALGVSSEVKEVKRLANDSIAGLHTRHAAKTEATSHPTREQVLKSVDATRSVLTKFQMHLMSERIRKEGGE